MEKPDEDKNDSSLLALIVSRVFTPSQLTSDPPPMPQGLGWFSRASYLSYLEDVKRERELRAKIAQADVATARAKVEYVDVLSNAPASLTREQVEARHRQERHDVEMDRGRLQNKIMDLDVQSRLEEFKQQMKDNRDGA